MTKKTVSLKIKDRGGDLSKRWYLEYYQDGRQIKKYGGVNSLATAKGRYAKLAEMKREIETELASSWHSNLKKEVQKYIDRMATVWRPKTVQTYQSKVDAFFEWLGIKELNEETAIGFLHHLMSIRRSPTTINKYKITLKMIFKELGYPTMFDSYKPLRENRQHYARYSDSQVRYLKQYMLDNELDELWMFCKFIYYCFLRPRSELRLLRVCDVNIEEGLLTVPYEVDKSRRGETIRIPSVFNPDVGKFLEHKYNPNEYLFPSHISALKPQGINTKNQQLKKVLNKLGFDSKYKLYSWKPTGACAAIKAGVSLMDVSRQMRHKSLEETKIYLSRYGVLDMESIDKFRAI